MVVTFWAPPRWSKSVQAEFVLHSQAPVVLFLHFRYPVGHPGEHHIAGMVLDGAIAILPHAWPILSVDDTIALVHIIFVELVSAYSLAAISDGRIIVIALDISK